MTDDILLAIGEDGKASLYDDTYDITIHCESQEEQDEVRKALENIPHWIPVTERLPESKEEDLEYPTVLESQSQKREIKNKANNEPNVYHRVF